MIILGLIVDNSAAAIMVDGKLLAAAREERFDRIKHSGGFPNRAMDYCLEAAGVDLKSVDQVVFAWNPGHELEALDTSVPPRQRKNFLQYVPNNLLSHIGGDKRNKKITSIEEKFHFFDGTLDVQFVPHHATHAAAAFFTSPFNEAAVLVIDAYGDDNTLEFFTGNENHLESLGATGMPHSLGYVYAAITQYLGFRANKDEWKVMGLAAYGKQTYYDQFAKLIRFDREIGEIRIDLDYFTYYLWNPRRYSDQFVRAFGPERYRDQKIEQRHMDIAASLQTRFEDVVIEICNYLHERTGLDHLCLSGGVAMNSKMNGRLAVETPFSSVWAPPASDDGGSSIGACFYHWNQVLGKKREFVLEHDYWGPEYSNEEIKATLEGAMIPFDFCETPEQEAAKSISEGKIIGWFQGKMEFGQRALGNRSMLADPRDPGMKEKINSLVKHREWYRPFAPSIMEEYYSDYFKDSGGDPFMQKALFFRQEKQQQVPSVVHEDGTGRVQVVSKGTNERFWKLIEAFRQITGVPLVLNTSFNDNDEPIVSSPKDALRTFFSTGIDELYLGNFRVRKS